MTILEFYNNINGNYQEAKSRLMNDTLILRFVKKFLEDNSFVMLEQALINNDVETAFRQAHTLKGVSANLAFTPLTTSSSEITEMLRAGNLVDAKCYFAVVKSDYESVVEEIKKL